MSAEEGNDCLFGFRTGAGPSALRELIREQLGSGSAFRLIPLRTVFQGWQPHMQQQWRKQGSDVHRTHAAARGRVRI